jgi:hypothetical protein
MVNEKKPHGNTGKKNAKKSVETKSSLISFRIENSKELGFKTAARKAGFENVGEWLIHVATEKSIAESGSIILFEIEKAKKTAYLNHVKNNGGGKLEHWLIRLADEELKRECN